MEEVARSPHSEEEAVEIIGEECSAILKGSDFTPDQKVQLVEDISRIAEFFVDLHWPGPTDVTDMGGE